MGGPALRCAAGKSNRARCFQRVALSTAPFFCVKCVLLFVLQDVRPESPGSNLAAIGATFPFFPVNRFCYARVRPPSQPRRSLEWRLGEEIGPSYAVGSSVSRGSNGAIACYLCAALPPFMPPPAAGDATASEHRGGGVRARRARRRRRAAAGGSAAVVDPRRRRAGVGVGRLAGAASPSESMGGPPDMGVYDT